MGVRQGQAEGRESWDPSKDKGSESGSGQSMPGAGTPKGKGLGGSPALSVGGVESRVPGPGVRPPGLWQGRAHPGRVVRASLVPLSSPAGLPGALVKLPPVPSGASKTQGARPAC